MKDTKPIIGFIGQGYIGKNYADDFERRGYQVVRYALEEPYVRNREQLAHADVIFIAVPTPTTPDGFDDSIVRNAIAMTPPGSVIVIKSTNVPGSTARLQDLFPDRFVMYSPEFLIARNAAHDAANPFMNIIGIPKETLVYRAIAEQLLSLFPHAPYQNICHSTEAEFIKYTHNTLGYIKIVWVNMLHDALKSFGGDWAPVRDAMEHDPMISKYYNDPVHQSGRGAGGACFIKDFAAFADMYKKLLPNDASGRAILESIEQKNIELLVATNKDMDLLRGVYGSRIPDATPKVLEERIDNSIKVETYGRRGFGTLRNNG